MIERRVLASGRVSWRVRWWHGETERSRSFKTKREALHFDRERQHAAQTGTYVDPQRGRVLVRDVWLEYLAAQVHLKPGTRQGYLHEYERRIGPHWGVVAVGSVTESAVQRWVQEIGCDVGPSTVRYSYRVLSLLLEHAVKTKRISENPAKGTNLPKVTRSRRLYLTSSAVLALDTRLRHITEETAYPDIVTLLALTGLRIGEATALTVRDYDAARRRLTVSKAYRQIGGRYVLGTPKTSAGHRQVAVPTRVAELLEARGAKADDLDAPLIATRRGTIVRPENLRRATHWQRTVTELGYPGLTLHDLRHTAASLAVQAGANVKVVQRMLGHASAAITLDVYADLFDTEVDQVAIRIDDLMR